ncbi:DHNAT1 [Citrus sinensis]|uniref:DHNAT1 n=1 Tax=Citrus sinensis TaxID=2711 RepID=A0ACB8IAY4_CITSI|nr:DHNAT1 [Citrus sinensis]
MEHSSSSNLKAALDGPLRAPGFQLEQLSRKRVTGHLRVTETVRCGDFSFLNVWEEKRGAGIQLSINHLKPAKLGDLVHAAASPINVGNNNQVWEVRLWKVDPSNSQIKSMVSSSTVTIACNMPVPDHAKPAGEILKMFAKL